MNTYHSPRVAALLMMCLVLTFGTMSSTSAQIPGLPEIPGGESVDATSSTETGTDDASMSSEVEPTPSQSTSSGPTSTGSSSPSSSQPATQASASPQSKWGDSWEWSWKKDEKGKYTYYINDKEVSEAEFREAGGYLRGEKRPAINDNGKRGMDFDTRDIEKNVRGFVDRFFR